MTRNRFGSGAFDLVGMAHQAMIDNGFEPDMPRSVLDELQLLQMKPPPGALDASTQDLRSLLWSSIDDRKSRDLDQVEYAESLPGGDVRLLVGIADVDALVRKGSAIDALAAANCTSVYTGVRTFHMLPEELSTDLTSLNDGAVKSFDVYPALVHNFAKLSYEGVGAWLDGKAPVPPEVATVPKMEEQIRLQFAAAQGLRQLR